MGITDLAGEAIKVTDLNLAISQADDYLHYRHADPAFAAHDAALQAYRQDVTGN